MNKKESKLNLKLCVVNGILGMFMTSAIASVPKTLKTEVVQNKKIKIKKEELSFDEGSAVLPLSPTEESLLEKFEVEQSSAIRADSLSKEEIKELEKTLESEEIPL